MIQIVSTDICVKFISQNGIRGLGTVADKGGSRGCSRRAREREWWPLHARTSASQGGNRLAGRDSVRFAIFFQLRRADIRAEDSSHLRDENTLCNRCDLRRAFLSRTRRKFVNLSDWILFDKMFLSLYAFMLDDFDLQIGHRNFIMSFMYN